MASDGWRAYTSLAAKGYVHRLVDHSNKQQKNILTKKETILMGWRDSLVLK